GDVLLGLLRDEALLVLHDRQAGHHGRLLLVGGVLRHFAVEPRARGVADHLSISPNTMSIVPMIATASAIMWPRDISSIAARCGKPGGRIFRRYGLLAPSLTM